MCIQATHTELTMKYFTTSVVLVALLSCVFARPDGDIGQAAASSCKDTIRSILDVLKSSGEKIQACTAEATGAGKTIYEEIVKINGKIDELEKLSDDWDACSGFSCFPVGVNMASATSDIVESLAIITDNVKLLVDNVDQETIDCITTNTDTMLEAVGTLQDCF